MLQQYSIKSIAMYSGIKFKVILKAKSHIEQNKSWNYTVTFDNILLYRATAYADDYQSKIQLLENLTNVRFGLGQLVSPTHWLGTAQRSISKPVVSGQVADELLCNSKCSNDI